MSAKSLLENMRDSSGFYRPEVLDTLWSGMPERLRTVELDSTTLPADDLTAFTVTRNCRTFRLRFHVLPDPVDRELAWCCWRIIELGGRVPVGAMQSLILWLTNTAADRPAFRGSLMARTPREWEKAITAAYARRRGKLPGRIWINNTTALLRRCYQILWAAYDPRPWWRREEWSLALDQRIPRRQHEPSEGLSLYFHALEPDWLGCIAFAMTCFGWC